MNIFEPSAEQLRVTLLVLPDSSMMSLASALDPMRAANRNANRRLFDWNLATLNGKAARLTCDLLVEPVWIRKAIAYRNGEALEHAFPLADGEEKLSTLRDTPIGVLEGDDLYAGRLLRDPRAEGEPRIGLDFPYPEDVSPEDGDPRGERR